MDSVSRELVGAPITQENGQFWKVVMQPCSTITVAAGYYAITITITPALKNLTDEALAWLSSGAKCKQFAHGSADATVTSSCLFQQNPE